MKLLSAICVLVLLSSVAQAQKKGPLAPVDDVPGLPRILLIGDSISIGYTLPVRHMLRGQANVHRPQTNCGPTTKGLEQLDAWLGAGKWDAIHFNFGLHDLKYIDDNGKRVPPGEGHIQVPKEQYAQNLKAIAQRLKKTGAKLIFCNTTPTPEGAHGRIPGASAEYNAAAEAAMKEVGDIEVNDLFGFCTPRLEEIQRKADVHFSREGSRQLAMQVVGKLRAALELPSPTPDKATGIVFEDLNGNGSLDPSDKPMGGIRVSNGQQIVETNEAGEYELPATDDDIFFVVKPRGYRTPINKNQLPQFFYIHKPNGSPVTRFAGVDPTGALPASINFPLYRQREPAKFKAILFGDPQPRTQEEVDFIAHDVVEELIGTDASFGVTLGDIVFDDLSLFESQARMIALMGIPWYNIVGNHDINYDAPNDQLSDESFERAFGPGYYSFDYGPVHFLVMDNVEWYIEDGTGKGKYRGGLGAEQLDFIRRDLAAIPDDQLVVLMMHIPLTDVGDRQELYRMIEKRPFCMSVAAHTHRQEHRMIGKEDGFMGEQPHHHVINVTVSGSWWSGQKDERGLPHSIMSDGAPNGYSTISFDGNQYKLDFFAAGRPKDYQMSIHAPEVVKSKDGDKSTVYANFFNGAVSSSLRYRVGESGQWREMDRVLEEDPYFRQIYMAEKEILEQMEAAGAPKPFRQLSTARPSTHLWKSSLPENLPVGTHLIHVRATDRHGRVYDGKRVLRVE